MAEQQSQTIIMDGVAMEIEMDMNDRRPLSNETKTDGESAFFTEQLKTDDEMQQQQKQKQALTVSGRRRRIEFSETVRVVLIPSHKEYAEDEKEAIWGSKKAIAAMASNNFIEFAAEGWDWRNVIDDEEMVVIEGEPVPLHPIHSNPYLKDALLRGIPYPTARAVTPPEEDAVMTEHDDAAAAAPDAVDDSGAVSYDCLPYEIERPASPFIQSDDDENDSSDDDDGLLDIDPEEYLRRRMWRNRRARTRTTSTSAGGGNHYDNVGCWLQGR
jgi:hypothetical protein